MAQPTQPTQAEIFAALSAQASSSSSRPKPSTSTFESFASSPIEQLTSASTSSTGKKKVNTRKIYCPREQCSSIILLDGVAELVEVEGSILPDESSSPFPAPSSPHVYWSIPSGPFAFENIGFSRPDTSNPLPPFAPKDVPGEGEGRVKWLICAECDLGPLGWSFEGGKGAWLDVKRLRYGEIDPA
ncbi:uncharacterized protein I303_100130 [Kwoniella dejecticola CBS 10117]|uniref:Mss4-like protein n=1 Tax=Kwoniella dejecticola CBS 10117 TaxID=1296121 RepID=A0A1A6AE50_9TREE|nr:uncharacterized protein I303_00130 [Kwoniella dejecticola CBS 10117]OBR88319.1 hypothetical protein I303_00130 [Kwoniella dejecticola CBS 10117]